MKRKKKIESIEIVEVLPNGEGKKIRLKDINTNNSTIMSREIKLWYKKFYSEKHKKDIKGFG